MKAFRTMHPYLKHIAEANNIKDPFDDRVVEAYWIGNELLDSIEKKRFREHLLENLQIKKRIGSRSFEQVCEKIKQGAVPHHSFHVFDIWKRTGNDEREHTVESMDSCRVSWGTVLEASGPHLTVDRKPLRYANGKLFLGFPHPERITRMLDSRADIDELTTGNIVSMHWGVICERITARHARMLEKYTLRHLELANQTI